MLRRTTRSTAVRRALGATGAAYLHLVERSSREALDPPDAVERIVLSNLPVIGVTWHGEHFLMPFLPRAGEHVTALVSRSADGEINAAALARLGVGVVRGSGGRIATKSHAKGAVRGFLELKTVLDRGTSVFMTADVPKGEARRAGLGVVTLARLSGRPILPLAGRTSRRIRLNSWDKAEIGLPFGRLAWAYGTPIYVSSDADDVAMEAAREQVQKGLNEAAERAATLLTRG